VKYAFEAKPYALFEMLSKFKILILMESFIFKHSHSFLLIRSLVMLT